MCLCIVYLINSYNPLLPQTDKEGPSMDDAADFFANVFGGERFEEYVRLFKMFTITKTMTTIYRLERYLS